MSAPSPEAVPAGTAAAPEAAGASAPVASAGTPRPATDGHGSAAAVHRPEEHPWHERFDVKEDRVLHKRYMTVYDRAVRFTSDSGEAHTVQYDVVGHPQCHFTSAVAFPFHPATAATPAQVTLVREYAQGPNALMYTLPCGGFDPKKHSNLRECAVAEMREEAMLVGGEVVELLPEDHPGQSELKWSRNKFKPFLFIDPQPDTSGHAERDAEEHTIEVMRVTIPELHDIIQTGQLMMLSVYATFLSLEVLKARKLI